MKAATTFLVPGFTDDHRIMMMLADALLQAGLDAHIFVPQPTDGTLPLETLAEQLAQRVAATLPPAEPIQLVGFSMGGLICRTYFQWFGGAQRTERLITLATPHNGTYGAYFFFNRPACVQMRPHSAFLTKLNAEVQLLATCDFISIWTPLDLTILPANSSVLPVGQMISIVSPLHQLLPLDPRVVKLVVAKLGAPHGSGETVEQWDGEIVG